jgi:carboxypeptidase Taq
MTDSTPKAYKQLLSKTRDLIILSTAMSLIHWDMETKMPPQAVEQRSLQLALLSRIAHKLATNPEIGKLLKKLNTSPDFEKLGETEKRNLHLIKKSYEEQTALPEKLVSEITKQQAITVNTWKKAKKTNNYNLLKPDLAKLLDLIRQEAEIFQKVKQTKTPYDALLDDYEPKMTANEITPIFTSLQKGLTTLLQKLQSTHKQPDTGMLNQPVPVEAQQKITTTLTRALGYDTTTPNARGRVDETEHPFTTGYYEDVRITTHYHLDNFTSSIFSVLHETGHAIYEENLNQQWKYQPIGSPCSMGIHESQSRFIENIIGRSKEFWTFMLPKIKQNAPQLQNLTIEKFVHAINKVEPSKIRIEADEVTYNLHIIIRFQIETDLFNNNTDVNELPQIWNSKYHELLGVKIETDTEGVMQDTHWPSGLFGYFPTYTLGNIYSGQMLTKIDQTILDWRNSLEKGNLQPVQNWLKQNIHSQSNLYDPIDVIKKATGQQLNDKPYLSYLNRKFGELYGF